MEVITTMKNPGNLGFLVLSRRLLTQMFTEMYGKWHSDSQAYVYLLMAACFTDQGDTPGCLKRGELFFSGRELSLRFAWSRRHVNHFIGELEQNGVVEVMKVQNCSKLRLLHYDTLCRMRVKNGADGRRRSAGDEMFEVFWEQYHDMTQQPALDIEAARKAWGKLTLAEREEAVGNIEMYLCMLPSIDRARTALKYLQMKSFVLN